MTPRPPRGAELRSAPHEDTNIIFGAKTIYLEVISPIKTYDRV